jgi:hypothetical protein
VPLSRRFRNVPMVSISAAQGARVPAANRIATVLHRLLAALHAFRPTPRGYLAFLGRISLEKRMASKRLPACCCRGSGLHLPRVVA